MLGADDIGERQLCRRTPESLTRSTNAGEASTDPFRDTRPLKFGEGGKNVQLQPTGGGRAIDSFAQRHERNAEDLHVLQQRDEVPEVAPEPIKSPDQQNVKSTMPRVRH
jgi:hypothetical protein